MKVGFVACSALKLDRPARAADLYTSPLFRLSVRWLTEKWGAHRWYVLSAKHGLVAPETVIEPYDQTLAKASKVERAAWGEMVAEQLFREWRKSGAEWQMMVLAGKSYCGSLETALTAKVNPRTVIANLGFDSPLEGKTIGGRLQWLSQELQDETSQWHHEWGTAKGEHATVDGIPVSVWPHVGWAWAVKPLVAGLATGTCSTREKAKASAVESARRLLAGEDPQLPPEVVPPPAPVELTEDDLRRQEEWLRQEAAETEALTYLRAFMKRIGRQTAQRIGLDEAWDWMTEDEEKDAKSGTVVDIVSASEFASMSDDALSAYAETVYAETMTAARRLGLDELERLGMHKLADLVRKENEERALTGAQGGK